MPIKIGAINQSILNKQTKNPDPPAGEMGFSNRNLFTDFFRKCDVRKDMQSFTKAALKIILIGKYSGHYHYTFINTLNKRSH